MGCDIALSAPSTSPTRSRTSWLSRAGAGGNSSAAGIAVPQLAPAAGAVVGDDLFEHRDQRRGIDGVSRHTISFTSTSGQPPLA